MSVVQRFLSAPSRGMQRFMTGSNRGMQLAVWLTLAAVLTFAVPAATGSSSPAVDGSAAVTSVGTPEGTSTLASGDDTLTLASGASPAGDVARENWATDNPSELLPAYRWRNSMELPHNLGYAPTDAGLGIISGLADVAFAVAGWIWWFLLTLTRFALTMDLVTSFSHAINGVFAATYNGLESTGLPALIVVAAVALGIGAVLRAKSGQAVRVIVSAVLVLGLLQTLGSAAQSDTASTTEGAGTGYVAPKGTPAWIAQTGNEFVNQIALQTSTLFGTTTGITASVRNGTAGPSEADGATGATCTYYNERLYSTYQQVMGDQGGVNGATGAAMSMVSFMWQRSMYDNWTLAAFGNTAEGGRIACHLLETNRNVSSNVQQAIAGTVSDGKITDGPYTAMGEGPFKPVGDDKRNEARLWSWAACMRSAGADSAVARDGWKDVPNFADGGDTSKQCEEWWISTESGALTDGGTLGIGGNDGGSQAFSWRTLGSANSDLDNKGEALGTVGNVVTSTWGHNGGQRFLASATALVSSGVYAYAFGGPSIGVMLSQFVLLFLLILLPWTLLVLAIPDKQGSRSQMGRKLLKMTAMSFGGKIVFMTVMGVTLTLMSALFSITAVKPEMTTYTGPTAAGDGQSTTYTMWSLLIPVAVIFVVRMLTKGLGLGNLMGLGGVMGFTTAAISQGRDGAKLKRGLSSATSTGKGTARAKKLGKMGLDSAKARLTAREIGRTTKDANGRKKPKYDDDLARKVSDGKMSVWQASREQWLRDKGGETALSRARRRKSKDNRPLRGLPESLAERVRKGELTPGAARRLAAAELKRTSTKLAAARDAREEKGSAGIASADELAGMAGIEGGAPTASPFKPAVGGTMSAAEIAASTQEMRDEARMKARELYGPKTQERWSATCVEPLGQAFEAHVAAVRAGGDRGLLTQAEVEVARADARSSVSRLQGERVLLGNSGGRHLVMPPLNAEGMLSGPTEMFTDVELAVQELSNPLLLLNPRELASRKDETEDHRHARLTMTLLEHNLLDPSGATVDVISELGLDRESDTFDRDVLELVEKMRSSSAPLAAVRRTSRPTHLGAIHKATDIVLDAASTLSHQEVSAKMADSVKNADVLHLHVDDTISKLRDAAANINVSVTDPLELGRSRKTILRVAEQEAEDLAAQVRRLTAQMNFQANSASGDLPAARGALQGELRGLTDQVGAFQRNLVNRIAAVIQSDGERSKEELVELSNAVAEQLETVNRQLAKVSKEAPATQQTYLAEVEAARARVKEAARAKGRRVNVHDA